MLLDRLATLDTGENLTSTPSAHPQRGGQGPPDRPVRRTALGAPLRVVVIDDDARVRAWVRIELERGGRASLVGESSGSSATVARSCRRSPDVVLLGQDLAQARATGLVSYLARTVPSAMLAVLRPHETNSGDAAGVTAGVFACYERMLTPLAQRILEDHRLFRCALAGSEVVAPSTVRGRRDQGCG